MPRTRASAGSDTPATRGTRGARRLRRLVLPSERPRDAPALITLALQRPALSPVSLASARAGHRQVPSVSRSTPSAGAAASLRARVKSPARRGTRRARRHAAGDSRRVGSGGAGGCTPQGGPGGLGGWVWGGLGGRVGFGGGMGGFGGFWGVYSEKVIKSKVLRGFYRGLGGGF